MQFKFRWVLHLSFIFIIAFYLFYYFYIGNFSSLLWYQEDENDADGVYTAQTLSILNGGSNVPCFHPGATISTLQGTSFKFLALFSGRYKRLMTLRTVQQHEDAIAILDTAVRTGRLLVLFTAFFFLVLFYFTIYYLTANALLSFFMTFCLCSFPAFDIHILMIRPELLSLFFLFCCILISVYKLKEYKGPVSNLSFSLFLPVGVFTGLALFSKIQIIPAILIYVACMCLYLSGLHKRSADPIPGPDSLRLCLTISALNLILMPWWATIRPSFIMRYYAHSGANFHRLFGGAPPNVTALVLVPLLILFIVSYFFVIARRRRFFVKEITGVFPSFLFFNSMVLGIIVSAYLIYLPISENFCRYLLTTRYLIYSMITGIRYRGFLQNPVIKFSVTFKKIFIMHSQFSLLFGINLLFIVGFCLCLSLVKLFYARQEEKKPYFLVMIFFVTGFIMDIFSTMRYTTLYHTYAIYSDCFYLAGLGLFLSLVFKDHKSGRVLKWIHRILCSIVFVFFLTYSVISFSNLLKQKRAISHFSYGTADREEGWIRGMTGFWDCLKT